MHDRSLPYFSTPDLSGLIQQLKHLSLFSADALVVEADKGAGKTSLADELAQTFALQQSEPDFQFLQITLTSASDLNGILANTATSLGLSPDGDSPGATLTRLRSLSELLIAERRLAIVLFDDAHFFPDDALGALLSLLNPTKREAFGLRFIFFAEPGLMTRIDAIADPNLSIFDFQLPAFSAVDLGRFLEQRVDDLETMQAKAKLPSTSAIWSRTGGLPGKALSFVEALLREASGTEVAKNFRGIPVLHLAALSLLVAGLILTLIYRGASSEHEPDSQVKREFIQPESTFSAGPSEPESATVITLATEDPIQSPSAELDTVSETSGAADPVNVVVSGIEPLSGEASSSSAGGNDVVIEASEASLSKDASQLANGAAGLDEDSGELPVKPSSEDTNNLAGKLPQTGTALNSSEKFLLDLPASAYVLQLVAASQERSLQDYISRQENRDMLHMYRRSKDGGGQWYIVVIGPYSSKAEAENARFTLPQNQQKAGPWPKSIASVQREIEAFRDK